MFVLQKHFLWGVFSFTYEKEKKQQRYQQIAEGCFTL